MGNPCAQLDGFRDLVIAWLPNLHNLDGQEISHSERIQARHRLHDLKRQLRDATEEQRMVRNSTLNEPTTDASYTPENRLKMYRQMAEDREKKEADKKKSKSQPLVEIEDPFREAQKRMSEKAVEAADGTLPKQRNQGQWEFSFEEDEKGNIIVDIGVEKYLATSLMDVDVHPLWFQVKIKDRLILLHFPEEVRPDSVRVQRIQANGHLVLILPKVNPVVSRKSVAKSATEVQPTHTSSQSTLNSVLESSSRSSRITPVAPVQVAASTTAPLTSNVYTQPEEPWEDNADVPPLE
jgi:protein TilB